MEMDINEPTERRWSKENTEDLVFYVLVTSLSLGIAYSVISSWDNVRTRAADDQHERGLE